MHVWVGFPDVVKGLFHTSTNLPTPSPNPPLPPLSKHSTTTDLVCSTVTVSTIECSRRETSSDRHRKSHWRLLLFYPNPYPRRIGLCKNSAAFQVDKGVSEGLSAEFSETAPDEENVKWMYNRLPVCHRSSVAFFLQASVFFIRTQIS